MPSSSAIAHAKREGKMGSRQASMLESARRPRVTIGQWGMAGEWWAPGWKGPKDYWSRQNDEVILDSVEYTP
jgi:hypothetical protein